MMQRRHRVDLYVIASSCLFALALLLFLTFSNQDISAARNLESDVALRGAAEPLTPYYLWDASPYSVWLPSDLFVWRSVRSLSLPLWLRTQGGGFSPLTNYYNGVLHPARWIVAVMPRAQVASALIVLGFLASFLGMYFSARELLDASAAAASLAAAVYAFSGNALSVMLFSGVHLVLAHLPWIAFGYARFVRRPSARRYALLVFLLASLVLTGHSATVFAVTIAGGVLIAADLIARKVPLGIVGVLSLAPIFALAVDAMALLPVALHWPEIWTYKTTTLTGISYHVMNWGEWRGVLLSMISDDFNSGLPALDEPRTYMFIGIGACLLAIAGVAMSWRRERAFVAALLVAGVLFSLPAPAWSFVQRLPGVAFCKSWYLLGILTLALAFLVAIGFDTIAARMHERSRGVICALLFALTIAPLLLRMSERMLIGHPPRVAGAALDFLRKDESLFRISGIYGQTHLPNLSELSGVEDVRLSSPVLPKRYVEWMQAATPGVFSRSFPTTLIPDRPESEVLRRFNVRYIAIRRVSTLGDDRQDPTPPRELATEVVRNRWVSVYQYRHDVRPRAFLTSTLREVRSPQAAIDAIPAVTSDPDVVETRAPLGIAEGHGGIANVRYAGDREVEVTAQSDGRALLVLNDLYDSGWRATVDGKSVDILPVNVVARGVVVPAGEHVVNMHYWPRGFTAGLIISALTTAALIALALRKERATAESI
jgi:hypothetical protein